MGVSIASGEKLFGAQMQIVDSTKIGFESNLLKPFSVWVCSNWLAGPVYLHIHFLFFQFSTNRMGEAFF